MHRIWMMYDPARVLPAVTAFLFTLALFIHFILLSSTTYNWIDGPNAEMTKVLSQNEAMPASRM